MEDTSLDMSKEDKKKLVRVDPDVERVRRYGGLVFFLATFKWTTFLTNEWF